MKPKPLGGLLLFAAACLPHAKPASTPPALRMAPAATGLPPLPAVVRDESPEQTQARLKWFREARFGMYIHWGDGKGNTLLWGAVVTASATSQGVVVALPGAAPDPDVSVVALEFPQPVIVLNAAPLPTDTGASATLAELKQIAVDEVRRFAPRAAVIWPTAHSL